MDRWTLKWQLSETGDTDSWVIGLQCSAPAYRINSCLAGVWRITISQRGDGQLFAPLARHLSHPWPRWCNFMTNKQRISYFVTRRSLIGGEETVGELKSNVPMKHELGILWSIILFTAITFKTLKSNRTTHFLFLRYIFRNVGSLEEMHLDHCAKKWFKIIFNLNKCNNLCRYFAKKIPDGSWLKLEPWGAKLSRQSSLCLNIFNLERPIFMHLNFLEFLFFLLNDSS